MAEWSYINTGFRIGTREDVIMRNLTDFPETAAEFREKFLEMGYGGCDGHMVWAGFQNPLQNKTVYGFYHMNNLTDVHLEIVVFDCAEREEEGGEVGAEPLILAKVDVVWNLAANTVGAYVDSEDLDWTNEVWWMLRDIFTGCAGMASIGVQDIMAVYKMPNIKGYDGPVSLMYWAANTDGGYVAVALTPRYINQDKVIHYAALVRDGWIPCRAPFQLALPYNLYAEPDDEGALLETVSKKYDFCRLYMIAAKFDDIDRVLHIEVGGFFYKNWEEYDDEMETIDTTAPKGLRQRRPVMEMSVRWHLDKDVMFFPGGSLEASTKLDLPPGEQGPCRHAFMRYQTFAAYLAEVFGACGVPRVLWSRAHAIRFVRKQVKELDWLASFREVAKNKLPAEIFDRMAMLQIPGCIREAYKLPDIVPKA